MRIFVLTEEELETVSEKTEFTAIFNQENESLMLETLISLLEELASGPADVLAPENQPSLSEAKILSEIERKSLIYVREQHKILNFALLNLRFLQQYLNSE